jgi:hypothetical protein
MVTIKVLTNVQLWRWWFVTKIDTLLGTIEYLGA